MTCCRKNSQLCVPQASIMEMASRSSWLACQMIRHSGSGNYKLSRISDGMTVTKVLSHTGVKISPIELNRWCGSKPALCIWLMPLRVALTVICHRNAKTPKCTLWTGGGNHTYGEVTEDNDMLINIKSTLTVGDPLDLLIFMCNGTHHLNVGGNRKELPVLMTTGNLSSKIHQMPPMNTIVIFTLLWTPMMKCNIVPMWLDVQHRANQEVLNEVLRWVLEHLTF